MRLKIFHFLMAGYLTIMLLMLSFGGYVAFELNRLTHINRLAAGVDSEVIQIAESLSTRLRIMISLEKKYWISKDLDFYLLFLKRQNEFLEQLMPLESKISETNSRTLLQTALSLSHSYFNGVRDQKKSASTASWVTYESKRDEYTQALLVSLKQIEQVSNLARYEKIRESELISTKVLWVTIVFATACVILSLTVSLLATKRIVQPIVLFQRKTRDIAAGNFTKIEDLQAPLEICHLADEFNEMSERLQELDRLKEDFVSHLSHTLRTPLTAIWEASEMLSKGIFASDPKSQSELMMIVRSECKRLIVSVNRILDLSRMESKMMDYLFVETDLNELIQDALARLSPIAHTKKIQMFFVPQPVLPKVLVDKEQIYQLLDNLVGNALKYTPINGSITLDVRPPPSSGALLQISVTDTGCGIEPQNLQNIFDKFRRIEKGKNTSRGSGLGLAIAQHIVKAHGGSIWVESKKDYGSTFYFSLPPA
ncbi:MAG: HAMP domain-containing histidine kinase [Desulfobulbaceae bacterium]|nr:HAMP domain-containing histidine kinase [Desulfobulbaceae bacterium]